MSEEVKLYIYDLSMGMAPQLSQWILKKHVEAIWHTSIVVFGKEHYFSGQHGIIICEPGSTNLGPPKEVKVLGHTQITEELFHEYLEGLKQSAFAVGTYNLLTHNCNVFSNELSNFLVGHDIPKYILDLPQEVVNTVIGQSYTPIINFLTNYITSNRETSPDFERLNNDIEEARQRSAVSEQRRLKLQEKLERQERKKNKKKKKKAEKESSVVNNGASTLNGVSESNFRNRKKNYTMSEENGNGTAVENGSTSSLVNDIEEQERREKEREEKKKQRDPPILFRDVINVQDEFDKLISLVDNKYPKEEMQFFEELHQYMIEDEGSWALSDGFLSFIGGLLQNKDVPADLKVHLLNLMAMAALKDDVILVLHQDRREHVFMNYANQFDRLPVEQQTPLALFVCNLFENPSSSEWLLYISEWEVSPNSVISNIRVTTKIAANSLLSENSQLQNYGTAIVHNLACKEKMHQNKKLRQLLPSGSVSKVFDDVAVELTMALLQFFNSVKDEEHVYRCVKAMAKFVQISQQEVCQLVQMIGPHPSKFRSISPRVDSYLDAIETKLPAC